MHCLLSLAGEGGRAKRGQVGDDATCHDPYPAAFGGHPPHSGAFGREGLQTFASPRSVCRTNLYPELGSSIPVRPANGNSVEVIKITVQLVARLTHSRFDKRRRRMMLADGFPRKDKQGVGTAAGRHPKIISPLSKAASAAWHSTIQNWFCGYRQYKIGRKRHRHDTQGSYGARATAEAVSRTDTGRRTLMRKISLIAVAAVVMPGWHRRMGCIDD